MGERWAVLLSFLKSAHLERHLALHVNRKRSSDTEEGHLHLRACHFSIIQGGFPQFSGTSNWATHFWLRSSLPQPLLSAWHAMEGEKCIITQYDTTSCALLGVNGAFRQASEAQVQTISGCDYLRSAIIPPTMQCLRRLKANRKWHLQIGTSSFLTLPVR